MGLLDELVGKATSLMGSGAGGDSGLIDGVMGMLNNSESGGLNGLVQSFQQQGLGDIISSWIGTGANQPISAEQVEQGLGSDMIQNLAAKAGLPSGEMSAKLAEILPGLVDGLTPEGTIPEGGILEKGLEFLKGKLMG